jgi:hypothetical protein
MKKINFDALLFHISVIGTFLIYTLALIGGMYLLFSK